MTRQQLLSLTALALPATSRAHAQMHAVVPQGVKPLRPAKFSGLPYDTKFVNVAEAAGFLQPIVFGVTDHADYIVESMGCGVAFLDYDNDGWQDVLLLTGQRYGEPSPEGAIIRLYKNNRDGTFKDVTENSGLGQRVWASGVTVADYDNDGFEDVFITCRGQNILLHNEGDGTFKDVTAKAGLLQPHTRLGAGCTWVDYDRDGHLDLFVSNYLVFAPAKVPARGKDPGCAYGGIPVECGPTGIQGEACILFHNNGDATFSLLFRNNRDGTFTERGLESGVALNEDGRTQEGMGLGIGDYDCDGSLDIFKTHFSSDTNVLYRNNGKGVFFDRTIRAGLGVETRFVGWGAAIEDFDNDGLPDQ